MKIIKYVIGIIFLILFLIFAIQNNNIVNFKFFMFHITNVPLFSIIILIFLTGFIFGRISGWLTYIFENKKVFNKKNNKD